MTGSAGQAGRTINLLIYAWSSALSADVQQRSEIQFLPAGTKSQASGSRACNLPTAWLSLGQLHRPLLEAKLAWGRGQGQAIEHLHGQA